MNGQELQQRFTTKTEKKEQNEMKTITVTLTRDQADALEWITDCGINCVREYLAEIPESPETAEIKQALQEANNALGVLQAALSQEIFAHDDCHIGGASRFQG